MVNKTDSPCSISPSMRQKPPHHSRDVFHSWMLAEARYEGPIDMPVLAPVEARPNKLISFKLAMKDPHPDFNSWVHFFDDDCEIEKFWHNPHAYVKKLSKFSGVLGLDYSVCPDFPVPLKQYNHFRNNACTYWLQQRGLVAVPQARCEGDDGPIVLASHPKHSSIAIGARSMVRRLEDREVLLRSVKYIVDELEPTNIIWYGSNLYGVANYPISRGIPIDFFPGAGRGELFYEVKE